MGVDPEFHLLTGPNPAVFLPRGSMLFDIDVDLSLGLERGDPSALAELAGIDIAPAPAAPLLGSVSALSLNIVQSCNLACSYCYADEGRFGGGARRMSPETAFASIDWLVDQGRERVTLGFIGGEPFLNSKLIHEAVAYAKVRAAGAGLALGFSVTTNATLLSADDLRLLRDEGFTVTVSLDGGHDHNRHRLDHKGAGSVDRVIERVGPLLADGGRAKVFARASVTRDDLDIRGRIDWLARAGFAEIGASPVRTGPRSDLALKDEDWPVLLQRMVEAADAEVARVLEGATPRFGNLWTALQAIHRGSARPLPCGSVASYLSVDVDGAFASCHRTVGDPDFQMGSVLEGAALERRQAFIETRLVDDQLPCSQCWARYLCGGGCHAEVASVGRAGCDYIRGWLHHCLELYRDVADWRPELLQGSGR